jgi:hypothetical protein
MDLVKDLGFAGKENEPDLVRESIHLHINLKLAATGLDPVFAGDDRRMMETFSDLLEAYREKNRLLSRTHCPVDNRIQSFLNEYLADLGLEQTPSLPTSTLILDRYGMARELSVPLGGDEFHSDIVSSYRIRQGVLHNPARDRRTTKGSFHVAEGGLPIAGDKKAVPKRTFAHMLEQALLPPNELMTLPYSANSDNPAQLFLSLLLRPAVCPEIPGKDKQRSMEIRFFAPGNLVSNLDFVESIFGNGGNPCLPRNNAALDVEHWSGHTGCVILAPHLTGISKKNAHLPHWNDATERQRKDGMCWRDEDELYNDGQAFKITARNRDGVIVTILADNYYGYCKKEVKTQISYATNLFGLTEEEHAGGALAFTRRNHGQEYGVDSRTREPGYDYNDMVERYGALMDLQPEGYGIDKQYPEVCYLPQSIRMDLPNQRISWQHDGAVHAIRLQPDHIYIQPNGYKIEMEKHPASPSWRLIGTEPEGTFCHKPSTVSGGGKSEISKSIDDSALYGPMFIDDLENDLDRVQEIYEYDYSTRFKPEHRGEDWNSARKPLDPERSLGSVIRLLSPSSYYTDEYNAWLDTIPPRIQALAFIIKRMYQEEWGEHWREKASVDEIDGAPGHELRIEGRQIIGTYLRMGFDHRGKRRTFKVRQDYMAAEKVQMEDDISVSVVVPEPCSNTPNPRSVKLVTNCEYRLFQRPDDAIIPGFDTQTEYDMAQPGNFVANFEPLRDEKLAAVADDVLSLYRFTPPMRDLIQSAHAANKGYVVSSAHPRLVNGKPSVNPRYLQNRPDLMNPVRKYVADIGARFHRKLPLEEPVCHHVDAVLAGRRNNPPEPGIRPLAVYNPIHHQELPELFMDFVCSLTGKSPSTTGAGSEGALTKGPFNALRPTADLNNALVSYIITGYHGFSSSAGHIGPNVKVAHDVSLLIPEIWARLKPMERDPDYLLAHGYLETLTDFEHDGKPVLASRLGSRITDKFVHAFLGKIFDNPGTVFTEEILKPETQDMEVYVDGIHNIVEAQQKVAQRYLDDGSIEDACPPLYALLHIMARGEYNGLTARSPELREMFTRKAMLASDWYQERLEEKQLRDIALWQKHVANLEEFSAQSSHKEVACKLGIKERLKLAETRLAEVQSPDYLSQLSGTIGADPLGPCREMQQAARQPVATA